MEDDNKLEQESDNIEKSEIESTSENKAEVVDSAVSKTEEKSETAEKAGDTLLNEESDEAKEAEVVEEDKDSEEKEYAEISEETKTAEEITEEAESEKTEVDVVSDDTNKSEDNKEAVEPEIEEVKESSDETIEDADITEKESSEQSIEEAVVEEKDIPEKESEEEKVVEEEPSEDVTEEIIVVEEVITEPKSEETDNTEDKPAETQEQSMSSGKPQSVIEELDKLKAVATSAEAVNAEKTEESVPSEDSKKTDSVEADSTVNKDVSKEKSEKDSKEEKTENKENTDVSSTSAVTDHKEEDDESDEDDFSFRRVFNRDFWKSFIFDVFFLGLCVWFTFVLIQKWFSTREVIIQGTSQVHGSIESGEKTTIGNINILVMGIDSVEGTHRSDTIFVLGVNPSKKKIMMLSIPRDTRVLIEDKGRKINEILPRYGEPTLRKILEDLLKITISRKVEVGFESFISVVDAIGGVDINIEKPMHYDDNWGNLHIHFNPGMNHLNGQDALRYVRFRKDAMADLGRIKRQQDFVKAVIKKIFSPVIIVRLPSIIETAFNYIKTDFTLQEIITLAKGFETLDVKFSTMSLPGEARYIDKISFFMPYSEEAIAIGNNYFSDLAILELEKDCDFGKVIPKQSKTNRKK